MVTPGPRLEVDMSRTVKNTIKRVQRDAPWQMPMIERFIAYVRDERGSGKDNTISLYVLNLHKWWLWAHAETGEKYLEDYNKETLFRKYNDYLASKKLRKESINALLAPVRMVYKWFEAEGWISKSQVPMLSNKGQAARSILVPAYDQIVKIRRRPGQALYKIAWFEMMLCCGLRVGETVQVRACDIDWDSPPEDRELQCTSPWFVATLRLDPQVHELKRPVARACYISKLAGKLIQMHMTMNRIPPDSKIPLFPYSPDMTSRYISEAGHTFFGSGSVKDKPKKAAKERMFSYGDLTEEDLACLAPGIRQKIIDRQKQAERSGLRATDGAARVEIGFEDRPLHAHALRHFFCCAMWYRSPQGERNNGERLTRLLGHSSLTQKELYLSKLDVLTNDRQWQRIFGGSPTDYIGLSKIGLSR